MNAAQTIGEIISAALVAEQARIDREYQDEITRWAMVTSANNLARMISEASSASVEEAFNALTYVPDACLPLLTTPHGWCALSHLVAADLGLSLAGSLLPTVH